MPTPDWGRTSPDYAAHRAGFPEPFFDRLAALGLAAPGLRALDVGAGTGALALGLAQRGARVTALDVSGPQLEAAAEAARARGLELETLVAPAERTGLPDASFDLAFAGQCWHWFDGPAAAAELARVLAPSGRLVIAHFDFLDRPGNAVRATFDLLRETLDPRADPRAVYMGDRWAVFGEAGLYPRWLGHVEGAGFTRPETFSFDVDVRYSREGWRGRMRASSIFADDGNRPKLADFDRALGELLGRRFEPDFDVPHRVFALIATRP